MPARTHTQAHPADRGGVRVRLPWWAIVLPTLAFAALLLLILNPSQGHTAGGPALAHLLRSIQHSVLHQT